VWNCCENGEIVLGVCNGGFGECLRDKLIYVKKD